MFWSTAGIQQGYWFPFIWLPSEIEQLPSTRILKWVVMGDISIFYRYLWYLWYQYGIVTEYNFLSYRYNNHARLRPLIVTTPMRYTVCTSKTSQKYEFNLVQVHDKKEFDFVESVSGENKAICYIIYTFYIIKF